MKKNKLLIGLGVAAMVAAFAWWTAHTPRQVNGSGENERNEGMPAAVVRVRRGPIENGLVLAGNFKAFQDVDVHAKVAGYIRTIYVDVGDHVKEGQVLAVLEVPELAAELAGSDAAVRRAKEEVRRAEGDVVRAKSAHAAAHVMCERLTQAANEKRGLVAQQEVDDAHAKDLESEAQVSSSEAALSAAQQALEVAQANHKQYSALSEYTRITAPFSGVITVRYADTGALIAAGTSSSTQSMSVVRLTQVSKLRLVLPIPESVAAQIHLGQQVKVRVGALNQEIAGKVCRFADALDLQTRTMETEIDFDNPNGKLMPGMYTETALTLNANPNALQVPLEAVAQNGNDATVLAVTPQNIIEERHIRLGIQGKTTIEVVSGLVDQDRVVIGNRSQFRNGQKVVPKEVTAQSESGGAS
jgi:RND family efflux transporter MFP subunit